MLNHNIIFKISKYLSNKDKINFYWSSKYIKNILDSKSKIENPFLQNILTQNNKNNDVIISFDNFNYVMYCYNKGKLKYGKGYEICDECLHVILYNNNDNAYRCRKCNLLLCDKCQKKMGINYFKAEGKINDSGKIITVSNYYVNSHCTNDYEFDNEYEPIFYFCQKCAKKSNYCSECEVYSFNKINKYCYKCFENCEYEYECSPGIHYICVKNCELCYICNEKYCSDSDKNEMSNDEENEESAESDESK